MRRTIVNRTGNGPSSTAIDAADVKFIAQHNRAHRATDSPRLPRLIWVMVLALSLVMAGCGSDGTAGVDATDGDQAVVDETAEEDGTDVEESTVAPTDASEPADDAAVAGDESHSIGVALIGEIGPVLAVLEGFKEEMQAQGFVEGENVTYSEHSAQGDQAVIPLMVRQVLDENPDLVLSLGTPVTIALAQETAEVPIIFGAMTDPVAAGVVDSAEAPGTNLTGTSDLLDPVVLLELIQDTLPDATQIGVISNTGEQNSAVQLAALEEAAPDFGIELVTAPVASTADVVPAAQSLDGRVDAVILPQDNTVGEAFEAIADLLVEAGLPVFASNVNRIEEGLGVAGVGVSYRDLGSLAAEQAASVLRGEAEPAELPVVYANSPDGGGLQIAVNTGMANLLGVTIPDEVLDQAVVHEDTPFAE